MSFSARLAILPVIILLASLVQRISCDKVNRIVRDDQQQQPVRNDLYKIGFGIADITGPSAEINMVRLG